ncbi:MAG: channel protein TolC, partial [Betaproteobacteria bacterium]|nr:channel protein TolC [Betaproteobacteria bacterium]
MKSQSSIVYKSIKTMNPLKTRKLAPAPLLAVALGASSLLYGSQTVAMDLLLAFREASSQDSQLASAQAQMRAVQQRLPQAQSLFLPTVNASANYAQQWTEVNTNPTVNYTSQGLSLSLNQPVFRLANFSTLEQSKLAITQVEAVVAATLQDLVLRVAQAYFEVLISQDALITLRAQERAISQQFEAAKRNFEVGTATITDQQEAQARLDLTRASVAAAQNDLQIKIANLSLLVGSRPKVVYALGPKVALPTPAPANEDDWVNAARTNNFSVLQSVIGQEIAKREIDKQRAANYPNVDAVVSSSASKGSSPFQPSSKIQNNSIGLQ